MNREKAVQSAAPMHEQEMAVAHASILKDVERLTKERDLLETEARRLATEVIQLQNGHRQLIATREFLLRQLEKRRRKQERQQRSVFGYLSRATRLVRKVIVGVLAKLANPHAAIAPAVSLERCKSGREPSDACCSPAEISQGTAVAVVVHAFYPELLPEILNRVRAARFRFDLFISCPAHALLEVHSHLDSFALAGTDVRVVTNRGRDIAPFLTVLPDIRARGYQIILKLHTKRSVHLEHGDSWRASLLDTLLAPASALSAIEALRTSGDIGIVGPRDHLLPLAQFTTTNLARVRRLAAEMGGTVEPGSHDRFFAGSMFFVRTEALVPLTRLPIDITDFEPEVGQIDGTLAHAVERLFVVSAQIAGCRLGTLEPGTEDNQVGQAFAASYRFGMINERSERGRGFGADNERRTVA